VRRTNNADRRATEEREGRYRWAADDGKARREALHEAQLAALAAKNSTDKHPGGYTPNKGFNNIKPYFWAMGAGAASLASAPPVPGQPLAHSRRRSCTGVVLEEPCTPVLSPRVRRGRQPHVRGGGCPSLQGPHYPVPRGRTVVCVLPVQTRQAARARRSSNSCRTLAKGAWMRASRWTS
jgi:hypothetical protein